MTKLYVRLQNWLAADEGATATEYAVLVGFIAILLITGALALSGALNTYFEAIADAIGGWATGAQ